MSPPLPLSSTRGQPLLFLSFSAPPPFPIVAGTLPSCTVIRPPLFSLLPISCPPCSGPHPCHPYLTQCTHPLSLRRCRPHRRVSTLRAYFLDARPSPCRGPRASPTVCFPSQRSASLGTFVTFDRDMNPVLRDCVGLSHPLAPVHPHKRNHALCRLCSTVRRLSP